MQRDGVTRGRAAAQRRVAGERRRRDGDQGAQRAPAGGRGGGAGRGAVV
jgi:hypothetical protein